MASHSRSQRQAVKVGTITTQEFVAGSWVYSMAGRFQCLKCGAVRYTVGMLASLDGELMHGDRGLSCKAPHCHGRAVPVTEDMSEIASLFATACGFDVKAAYAEINEKYSSAFEYDIDLLIRVEFNPNNYTRDMFCGLPYGYFTHTSVKCGVAFVQYQYKDLHLMGYWERELVRDDALQALYDWISDIHAREVYKIWQLAGLLSYGL